MSPVEFRPLRRSDADACDRIIAELPYHFGDPGGRETCATAVRTNEGLVACRNGDVIGFLVYERAFDESAEITWMAVNPADRRSGVGQLLVSALREQLIAEGRTLLLVMTVGPSEPEDGVVDSYCGTRAFYESVGFIPAREWPNFWDVTPALLLVMPLSPSWDLAAHTAR
jgi:ribosomal protein S18 acetylase RimI-like enzyme